MKLYTYWRSTAAYRVRIALAFKGIEYESIYVDLLEDGGIQFKPEYKALNPQCLVPTLILNDGTVLTQSMAILEYLEEAFPEFPLQPNDTKGRARVREICQAVLCDIHPLNNLRILTYLKNEIGIENDTKLTWYRHWIEVGFTAVNQMLSQQLGSYCHGNQPTHADICLIPQIYNARRFEVDLSPFQHIQRIEEQCLKLEPFKVARPESQGDARE